MTLHEMVSSLVLLCLTADAAFLKLPLDSPKDLKRRGRTYEPSFSDNDVLRFPIVRQERQFHKRQEPYTTPFAFIDTLPHLELGIGNTVPPQKTGVLIDTGSSELWVYSTALRDNGSYDPSLSTSDKCYLTPTFNVSYGDGTDIDGYYCTEIIQMSNLTVNNMTIGVPQTAIGEFAGNYGILGLGFKSGQRPVQKHSTLVDKMFEDGLIPARSYGIFLNQADSSEGEITFGGANLSRVVGGELSLLSMVQTEDPEQQAIFTWLTAINSAAVSLPPVLLDTGTPYSRFPPFIVNAFAEAYNFTRYARAPGFFEAPCSLKAKTPGIKFTFSDAADLDKQVKISMPWSEAVVEIGDNVCLFAFGADRADADYYIMGQTFLQSTYLFVDLDNLTIGLGQAKWD